MSRLPTNDPTQVKPDSDEFDAFYRGTAARLVRYAYGLTTDAPEAQDLVQEAYARAWQRWQRLRGYEDAEAFPPPVVVAGLSTMDEKIVELGRIPPMTGDCGWDSAYIVCPAVDGFHSWRFAAG